MNFHKLSFIFFFAVCFCSVLTAQAQPNYPKVTRLNLTSNSQERHQGETFTINCEYELSKPQGQNQDSDWEISVGFHKDLMSASPDNRFPTLAEYRRT